MLSSSVLNVWELIADSSMILERNFKFWTKMENSLLK